MNDKRRIHQSHFEVFCEHNTSRTIEQIKENRFLIGSGIRCGGEHTAVLGLYEITPRLGYILFRTALKKRDADA